MKYCNDMEEFMDSCPRGFLWDNGIFGYNYRHLISHPWKIVGGCWREFIWAWQRVFRGWDDRVIWSIEAHLSKRIPEWILAMKDCNMGLWISLVKENEWNESKTDATPEAWGRVWEEQNEILDNISDGFKAYNEMDLLEYGGKEFGEAKKKFDKGLQLFREYFENLWT